MSSVAASLACLARLCLLNRVELQATQTHDMPTSSRLTLFLGARCTTSLETLAVPANDCRRFRSFGADFLVHSFYKLKRWSDSLRGMLASSSAVRLGHD